MTKTSKMLKVENPENGKILYLKNIAQLARSLDTSYLNAYMKVRRLRDNQATFVVVKKHLVRLVDMEQTIQEKA